MTNLDHLLPPSDTSPRCADHARTLAIDPGGTGIRADRVVLVETPLPWPKPVFDHPALRPVKDAISSNPLVRLWATVAESPGPGTGVFVFDRMADGGVRHHRYRPETADDLEALARSLALPLDEPISHVPIHDEVLTTPVALVCTQGSHDVCCGADGARFATEAGTIEGVTVFRVSHTGGHRFAPTAMTFPDGRMWAYLDREALGRVLAGDFPVENHRGWWGADPGAAQVAEAAVRGEHRAGFDGSVRTVTAPAETGDARSPAGPWAVSVGDQGWLVDVELVRQVPTISCRAQGGTPYKTANEYQARLLD